MENLIVPVAVSPATSAGSPLLQRFVEFGGEGRGVSTGFDSPKPPTCRSRPESGPGAVDDDDGLSRKLVALAPALGADESLQRPVWIAQDDVTSFRLV